ncbi:MAG: TIGR00266 family protein [Pseudomonadales bacterium]
MVDEVTFDIQGESMQFVDIALDPGETVIAEAGMMMYMTEGIDFATRFGDGSEAGLMGKLWGAAKRALTSESLFLTHFSNEGSSEQHVAFSGPYPGQIVPVDLGGLSGDLLCQKDAFLCAAKGIRVSVAFTKRLGAGFFGGEGFVLQQLTGDGLVFLHAGGTVVEHHLKGENVRVDTGCLVGFESTIDYDIQLAGGLKSMLFGGEGLFLTTLEGTGRVWLQSLPFARLADRVLQNALHLKQDGEG